MNQATIPKWTTEEAIAGCARAGYVALGLWRDRIIEAGPARLGRLARGAGLQISSLCRGGWFCASDLAGRRARMEDNFRAVEEAEALGALRSCSCAAAADNDLEAGHREVADAIAELRNTLPRHGFPSPSSRCTRSTAATGQSW